MSSQFLEHARHEALRYGSDPWIFVRELLQNARDAGARTVALTAEERGGLARIVCSDDGRGMGFEHARRYLFALYASSKDGDRRSAGRFGVGFWSILRFEPMRIVVRSWPRKGPAWEVELDGGLTRVVRRRPAARRQPGTEIVLERPAGEPSSAGEGQSLARKLREAAWLNARFLRRRDHPREPLVVRVNGEPVMAKLDLPAPSARFRKGRLQGVVGLGREARVELFAHGLRVRSAAAVEDLLSPGSAAGAGHVGFAAVGDAVMPQVILDADGLEPMLARSDVRETRELRRLVALAQAEVRKLVQHQMEAVRPSGLGRHAAAFAVVGILAAAALGGAWLGRRHEAPAPVAAAAPVVAPQPVVPPEAVVPPPAAPTAGASLAEASLEDLGASALPEVAGPPIAYRDLGPLYHGPRADTMPARSVPLALLYAPPEAPLRFAALLLDRPFEPPPPIADAGSYDGPRCAKGCVDVALMIVDGPGALRLPIPSGHRLDTASVQLEGETLDVRASAAGEPLVALKAPVRGIVRYRTGPWTPGRPEEAPRSVELPQPLAMVAERLRQQPPVARAGAAMAWVQQHVAYSTAPEIVERHRAATAAGQGVLESALAIGAGDCDIQNGVLAVLLRGAGVPARLAVGYVGSGGLASTPLHAWVEVREGAGPWRIVDASEAPAPPVASAAASLPQVPFRWLISSLAAACLGGLVLASRLRPWRAFRLAPEHGLVPLLRGALQRPEAFRGVPEIFERRLVPTIGRRRLSLGEAWDLAEARRLFLSTPHSTFARRAAARGAVVLDASRPEARVVADALGAVDLDEWDALLLHSHQTLLLETLGWRLRRLGEAWDVWAVARLGRPAVLNLPDGGGYTRIIVVDAEEAWLRSAEARFTSHYREAIFAVAERLVEILGVDGADRDRVLATLAREAVQEAAP
jgi:transglutaminase-like putative cysteine protease